MAQDSNQDLELAAIQQLMAALDPLEPDARTRVLDYVFQRLGIEDAASRTRSLASDFPPSARSDRQESVAVATAGPATDIRSLTEAKSPRTAREMAAVVAYYLSELAPQGERSNEITAADIQKYFKQAKFPLPGTPSMTLVHSQTAGYLDPGGPRGTYRLNPVGYNLVAHKMPTESSRSGSVTRKKRKTKKATKKTKKKRKTKRRSTGQK